MKIIYALLIFSSLSINGQSNVVDWLNSNAIYIEDANPDSKLLNFDRLSPVLFNNASIFGFGEASHHGKEFFDIKSKFFKYLVEKKGVKVFIMEENYQAEKGINEWIRGGKGDSISVMENFTLSPWHCKEVAGLLSWMRHYNKDKTPADQIRFYGMDAQVGKGINLELRSFISRHNIKIEGELLKAADECSEKKITGKEGEWATMQLINLEKIEKLIVSNQLQNSSNAEQKDYMEVIRALSYLKSYITYMQNYKTEVRDEQMYNNVLRILKDSGQNQAFIWAHNEHINKQGHSKNIVNLGNRLKNHFKTDYFSVGFDFGTGILPGMETEKGEFKRWKYYSLDKPIAKTFAETLARAKDEIYFVDLDLARQTETSNFFLTEHNHLAVGGPGINPTKKVFIKRSYIDAYDALIFVRKISPTSKLSTVLK